MTSLLHGSARAITFPFISCFLKLIHMRYTKKCELCGNIFKSNSLNVKYCSSTCRKENKRKLNDKYRKLNSAIIYNKNCSICGKNITTSIHNKKYCSNECSKIAHNTNSRKRRILKRYEKEELINICSICGSENIPVKICEICGHLYCEFCSNDIGTCNICKK